METFFMGKEKEDATLRAEADIGRLLLSFTDGARFSPSSSSSFESPPTGRERWDDDNRRVQSCSACCDERNSGGCCPSALSVTTLTELSCFSFEESRRSIVLLLLFLSRFDHRLRCCCWGFAGQLTAGTTSVNIARQAAFLGWQAKIFYIVTWQCPAGRTWAS
jgi:hypothetical protein